MTLSQKKQTKLSQKVERERRDESRHTVVHCVSGVEHTSEEVLSFSCKKHAQPQGCGHLNEISVPHHTASGTEP